MAKPTSILVVAALVLSGATAAARESVGTEASAVSLAVEDSERSRVRAHLLEAEAVLRERDLSGLTKSQATARLQGLDVLHRYAEQGVFPRNLAFRDTRAPYFIDDGGRACAVAELITASGHRELAAEVARRENNAYVMDIKTAAVLEWASASGFSIDELAYIQPDYCPQGDPPYEADCVKNYYSWNPGTGECTEVTSIDEDGSGCHLDDDETGRCKAGVCEPVPGDCGASGPSGEESPYGGGLGLLTIMLAAGARRLRRG